MRYLFILFFLHTGVSPLMAQKKKEPRQQPPVKEFVTADRVYETSVKTALLYPHTGQVSDYLQPAIVSLSQSSPLVLSFDELGDEMNNYYVKIIHCNANWTKSSLSDIQFLHEYNEFFITERYNSINALVPYIHYRFVLPRVKISGNYVIKVYRNYDEDDIVLSRRFMVYEDINTAVIIQPDVKFARAVAERDKSQQVDFSIAYGHLNLINPAANVNVVIRQNHRWDKAIYNLPPMFVKEHEGLLEYNYFNMENAFRGGNEFNAFDISSLISYKLNVGRIVLHPDLYEVVLVTDASKRSQTYSVFPDIDGKFWIEHYESGERHYSPDYVLVNFVLDVPRQSGDIYVRGAMNDWQMNEQNLMTYNEEIKKYTARLLLKQGYYNYLYTLVNNTAPYGDDEFVSGSHSQTQNVYDILVYYRHPGERADLLIGYTSVNYMRRN